MVLQAQAPSGRVRSRKGNRVPRALRLLEETMKLTDSEILERFLAILEEHGLSTAEFVGEIAGCPPYTHRLRRHKNGEEWQLMLGGDGIDMHPCQMEPPGVAVALILRAIQDRLDEAGVEVRRNTEAFAVSFRGNRWLQVDGVFAVGMVPVASRCFPCRPSAMLAAYNAITQGEHDAKSDS